jgi:hypothetical protein
MNITEQKLALIKTIEASIADKERQLLTLTDELKIERAQLKKIKSVFDDNKQPEKTLDKDGQAKQ